MPWYARAILVYITLWLAVLGLAIYRVRLIPVFEPGEGPCVNCLTAADWIVGGLTFLAAGAALFLALRLPRGGTDLGR